MTGDPEGSGVLPGNDRCAPERGDRGRRRRHRRGADARRPGKASLPAGIEAARTAGTQRFVGTFAAIGFGSLLALDARELARRDFGALHEKCDIFQAGAGTGGSPKIEDALHPLLNRQDEGLDVVVGRRWQAGSLSVPLENRRKREFNTSRARYCETSDVLAE